MDDLKALSDLGLTLNGKISVWSVDSSIPEDAVLEHLGGEPLMQVDNLVVSSAVDAIINLLRGRTSEYLPAYISIGSGGDLDQTTRLDTGSRVPPAFSDNSMRALTARIPIITTEDGESSSEWSYVAVARPHEALSPIINELGVETSNGTLVSHYITDAGSDGKSLRYCKTSLEYLVIRWTYTLSLTISGSIEIVETPTGVYLSVTDSNGNVILSILAEPRPGASTPTAILSQIESGAAGTIDVQVNGTITSQTAAGGGATITLTVVE